MHAQLTACPARTYLPSDPDFLLEYMAGMASDDSNDDFDGYLLSDEEPEAEGENYLRYKIKIINQNAINYYTRSKKLHELEHNKQLLLPW